MGKSLRVELLVNDEHSIASRLLLHGDRCQGRGLGLLDFLNRLLVVARSANLSIEALLNHLGNRGESIS